MRPGRKVAVRNNWRASLLAQPDDQPLVTTGSNLEESKRMTALAAYQNIYPDAVACRYKTATHAA